MAGGTGGGSRPAAALCRRGPAALPHGSARRRARPPPTATAVR